MVKLVYSFNTTPNQMGLENIMGRQIVVYKKAMEVASRFYPITLWTDERGAEELGEYATEIKMLKKSTPNYLWCEPKYEAMLEEDADTSIFIDGDVFLAGRIHFNPDCDVHFEHFEERTFAYGYKPQVDIFNSEKLQNIFPEWTPTLFGAYNVGILKFGSNEIKHKFRDTFYRMKDYYYNVANLDRVKFSPNIPEMVMEEYALHCLSKFHNWKVDDLSQHNDYIHMYGFNKYRTGFLNLIYSNGNR